VIAIVNGLLVRAGTVLLARRSANRKAYPGTWSFPGGHTEQGETLDTALIRELREELAITPTTRERLGTLADPHAPRSAPSSTTST
jgi:mutator protein MutT